MSDITSKDIVEESFGVALGNSLLNLSNRLSHQANQIRTQGLAALGRAEQMQAWWGYFDDLGYKLVDELGKIKTEGRFDAQLLAQIEAMRSELGKSE